MTDLYTEMKAKSVVHYQRFKLDLILDSMDDEEAKSLRAALADQDIPHVTVARVLRSHGHSISAGGVRNWRHGQNR